MYTIEQFQKRLQRELDRVANNFIWIQYEEEQYAISLILEVQGAWSWWTSEPGSLENDLSQSYQYSTRHVYLLPDVHLAGDITNFVLRRTQERHCTVVGIAPHLNIPVDLRAYSTIIRCPFRKPRTDTEIHVLQLRTQIMENPNADNVNDLWEQLEKLEDIVYVSEEISK